MATRLVLVGGFLGAGKTTLLLNAAHLLAEQGYRVGLVTNDQGRELVDTALVNEYRTPVVEVAGGCFCCRLPDFLQSLTYLQETIAPDIILAEPVGSCTDLTATVMRPLFLHHQAEFQLTPLTVLLDPQRELSIFPGAVDYLYRKQLGEAQILLLSKSDLLAPAMLNENLETLKRFYPDRCVMSVSAKTGAGVVDWLASCLTMPCNLVQDLELDYVTYAEAEACLGWLNASGSVQARQPFSAGNWLAHILETLAQAFIAHNAAIAHIKIQVTTPTIALKASLTQLGQPISWDLGSTASETDQAQFLINARVNTDPGTLERIVRQVVETKLQPGFQVVMHHLESFSPLPPRPTVRLNADALQHLSSIS